MPDGHLQAPDSQGLKLNPADKTAEGSILFTLCASVDAPVLVITGTAGSLTVDIASGHVDGTIVTPAGRRHLDAEDTIGIADGQPHTVGLSNDAAGLHLFVDGYEVFSATSVGWLEHMEATEIALDPEGLLSVTDLQLFHEPLGAKKMIALAVAPQTFVEFAADCLARRDIQRCEGLWAGALQARFRCRGVDQAGTILAAGGENGLLELFVDSGDVVYKVSRGAEVLAQVRAPGHWDLGDWHDVVVSAGRGAVTIYMDGYQVAREPGLAFLADVAPLEKITVGKDLDNARLFGEAQSAAIYQVPLSDTAVKRLGMVEPIHTQALFDTGLHGSASYRIPSLLRLRSGVLLAGADRRVSIPNDSPNDIDFVLRRSTDDGLNWEDMQTLIRYPGTGLQGASATDSVLVQDAETGRVFVVIDHFPGATGQLNSVPGTGFAADGSRQLYSLDGSCYLLGADGVVRTEEGAATDYVVHDNGDILRSGKPAGNIYLAHGENPEHSLYTLRTSSVQLIYSDDDGLTWSSPRDITAQIKAEWMRFLGTSPGNGIQLCRGEKAGRLLVPVYYNHEQGRTFSCAVIYSDDHGDTWKLGQSPNDQRAFEGQTLSSRDLADGRASLYESTVVEGKDGSVHVFARNQHPSGRVAHAVSMDGGETWSQVDYPEQLPEIFSQPNAINVDIEGKSGWLFANASRMLPFRGCGVLRLSFDDGRTWPHNRVLVPRHYVYQCATQLSHGDIGLLWERETQGLFFSIIPQSWLLESRSTQD